MPMYNITATSAKKTQTISNTPKIRVPNPEETAPAPVIPFPSPAEFADKAAADAQAVKYAKWLNSEDFNETWDWVGTATAI